MSLLPVVSVRKGHEGVCVYDAFVEDESVFFGSWKDSHLFGGSISRKKVRIGHWNHATLLMRMEQFFQDVAA